LPCRFIWFNEGTQRLGCGLAPSPPAEKTAARQDQAGQAGADDGSHQTGWTALVANLIDEWR